MADCIWRDGGWVARDSRFTDEQMLEMECKYKELVDGTPDVKARKMLAELALMNDIELLLNESKAD